jgi:hypothetical protein
MEKLTCGVARSFSTAATWAEEEEEKGKARESIPLVKPTPKPVLLAESLEGGAPERVGVKLEGCLLN